METDDYHSVADLISKNEVDYKKVNEAVELLSLIQIEKYKIYNTI